MTTLVAIGCSHMAGCELDGQNTDSYYNRQNCFAARVAAKLGYSYLNLAVSGGSNQFVHRKVVEFVTTHARHDEQYFFLIGWTTSGRMELRYTDSDNYVYHAYANLHDEKYFPFTVGTGKNIILDDKMKKLTKFVDILFEDTLKETETATLAWSTQEILKHNNHRYYMINTCNSIKRTQHNHGIVDKLDTNFFYNPEDINSSYFYYCINKFGFKKYSEYWHHYEPAHIKYSDFLEMKIRKAYHI